MEGQRSFEISGGYALTTGNMAVENASKLTHTGLFDWGFAFGFYGREGVMGKKDIFGMKLGWDFHYNTLAEKSIENLEPTPASYAIEKKNMLAHGPYIKVEYTLNYRVQPMIGLGAHLLGVRGSQFTLYNNPKDNFYKEVVYTPGGWGRINPAFSANAGFRILISDKFALNFNYELFLRNSWTTKYKIEATPASSEYAKLEQDWYVRQIGWMHHATATLQFLLR